jgi:CBS domain containing-hemolysin-like protein
MYMHIHVYKCMYISIAFPTEIARDVFVVLFIFVRLFYAGVSYVARCLDNVKGLAISGDTLVPSALAVNR